MPLVSTKYLVTTAYQNQFAVGAFNVGNSEFVKNIIGVAEELEAPVILEIHPLEYELMGSAIFKYIREAALTATVPVAIHLDHGRNMADVLRAIQDQANSVMIDSSGHPFDDNLKITKEVVEVAHSVGVSVEAELGSIGNRKFTEDQNMGRIYTDPESAKEFVQETGVDDLAVAIGTVHGPYPSGENDIRIDILKRLNEALHMPLVLHGGSDNPDSKIREAIQNGIAKVNISTDIKVPFYHGIAKTVSDKPGDYEPWVMTPFADEEQRKVIAEKIRLFGSDHKLRVYLEHPEQLRPFL
ncbi:ketose-bisphosphate aldolase [Lacticaseibacillus parahuelsenbergensis]|uniref:Ketose-bisphosphate aldolase n=1 Tax=Lacticaseibacillus parahuelsenbergensis TaxID=3068305 RepID=A0ABY9L7C5_9LACO|nr:MULTISPECIES: ketose-bisphosphate aldolase [Lacticaseibacillus]MDE3281492.1 ketose-bisphosphate aldolase [Lacticaseibacillus casei]WLV78410.1 ketose-bisphosphate aldolase [Lacticaseibacillus sp. NCIMB 15471]